MSFSSEFQKIKTHVSLKTIWGCIFLVVVITLLVYYFSSPDKWEGWTRVYLWIKSLAKRILIPGV